ncbi:unnamed protein product [Ophioblennius macclurei]
MFKTISRLIFGGAEETPEDVKCGEVVGEEGWHVVTHQEADSGENQDAPLAETQPSSPSLCGSISANIEADCTSEAEPEVQNSSSVGEGGDNSDTSTSRVASGAFSQPKTQTEIERVMWIHRAKAWADRHYVSRNAIQRQNRVRHGVQAHSFQLQQPGNRSLGH